MRSPDFKIIFPYFDFFAEAPIRAMFFMIFAIFNHIRNEQVVNI